MHESHKSLSWRLLLVALATAVSLIVALPGGTASARPTITRSCPAGWDLAGNRCTRTVAGNYVEATPGTPGRPARCPSGYDPFPGTGTVEKCYADTINYTACPSGGSPDPTTLHSDGTFKGCLAPVIPEVREIPPTPATCNGVATAQPASACTRTESRPATQNKFCGGERVTVDLTLGQSPTEGNDVIWGTMAADTISALGGHDVVCGRGGGDRIAGGPGRDRIFGNAGNDYIYGGDHRDRIWGNSGNDVIYGGGRLDRISGGYGDDFLYGGPGPDRLYGQAGNDTIYGNKGRDRINGGVGSNRCFGGSGADTIESGTCL